MLSQISEKRKMAISFMNQKKWSEALQLLLILTNTNSDDWSLYYMIGQG